MRLFPIRSIWYGREVPVKRRVKIRVDVFNWLKGIRGRKKRPRILMRGRGCLRRESMCGTDRPKSSRLPQCDLQKLKFHDGVAEIGHRDTKF